MERGSDKHSARQDDALAGEVELMMRGGKTTHAQEWKDPEPSGEDQPDVDFAPNGTLEGGTPAGMTAEDVETRSALAQVLHRSAFPGDRDQLVAAASEANAPESLLDQLETLPAGTTFGRVEEVWEALGGGHEQQRF